MPDSLFTWLSLSSLLDSHRLGELATRFGQPEPAIREGMESVVATVTAGLASRSNEPGSMRQVIDLASEAAAEGMKMSAAATGGGSAPAAGGKRFLATLFGGNESRIADALGTSSGLRSETVSGLMATAAPLVLTAIGRQVREKGLTATGLAGLLQQERLNIQQALPAGLASLLGTGRTGTDTSGVVSERIEESPVVAQAVLKEKQARSIWMWLIPLALVLIGLIWYLMPRHTSTEVTESAAPAAATSTPATTPANTLTDLGPSVKRQLPDNVELSVPEKGVEVRLLEFIKDPSKPADQTSWFDFDRLLFNTASTTLQPQSQEQLQNVAAILKAYPNAHIKVGGYTDNTGDAAQNLKLSQGRAESVVAGLVGLGVAANRLEAKGYGEQHPVADNSTDEGRAKNRRVSMLVTQK